jgi:hypothetical protein
MSDTGLSHSTVLASGNNKHVSRCNDGYIYQLGTCWSTLHRSYYHELPLGNLTIMKEGTYLLTCLIIYADPRFFVFVIQFAFTQPTLFEALLVSISKL